MFDKKDVDLFQDKTIIELSKIQLEFFNNNPEFIYFRKGEAENNILIILGWLEKNIHDLGFSFKDIILELDLKIHEINPVPETILEECFGLGLTLYFIENYHLIRENISLMIGDIRKLISFIRKKKITKPTLKIPEFKEIGCPNDDTIIETFKLLKEVYGKTKIIHEDFGGKFRYFVNNKQYCIFVRRGNGTFSGFKGNNLNMIETLKETFEWEWDNLPELK